MHGFSPNLNGFYAVGDQLTADLRRRAQVALQHQLEVKNGLTTLDEWEAHRQRMRANFLSAIGGLPGPEEAADRQVPPAAITGLIQRPGYTVEKVIYHSLPGYRVTSNLYVPTGLTEKAAAVVMVMGHGQVGKAYPNYQAVCQDLVHNGFVVLAIDPLGQGERQQFLELGQESLSSCTVEHTHSGLPFWLAGKSVARLFAWDIMRGLDYLAARPEVDAERVGITGNSGGGTQACQVMLVEPRLKAAVPCTFVMTLETYQKTGQPQDAEQIIPGCMKYGPDHDDFLTALAPKPVLVGAAAYDFFPIEGTREAVRRAAACYQLHGKPQNLQLVVAPTRHQYGAELRQACVNWFRVHLQGRKGDFVTASQPLFPEPELWCCPTGNVYRDYPDTLTSLQVNLESLPAFPVDLAPAERNRLLRECLAVEVGGDRIAPLDARIIEEGENSGRRTEHLFFLSAPDIAVAGVLYHPAGVPSDQAGPATLLLLEHGTADIGRHLPLLHSLLDGGQRVLVFDVRGVGALRQHLDQPELESQTFNYEYKTGCDAMMLGLSTLGLRVFDVLRGYDYLMSRPDVSHVRVYGVGSGATFGFFASALEEGISGFTGEEMLLSYRDLCQTPDYRMESFNLKIMALGLLGSGDVLDHAANLQGRPCHFLRPLSARGCYLPDHKLG